MTIEERIDNMVQELPFYLKREVLDYVEFVAHKHHRTDQVKKKFKFGWEGGLADIKDKMTSVELQHRILDWR